MLQVLEEEKEKEKEKEREQREKQQQQQEEEASTWSPLLPHLRVRAQVCPEHEAERLRLWCGSCETLICRECAIFEHRSHAFEPLSEAAVQACLAEEALQEELRPALVEAEDLAQELVLAGSGLERCRQLARERVQHSFVRLRKAMAEREAALLQTVEDMADAASERLESQASALQVATASTPGVAADADTSEEGGKADEEEDNDDNAMGTANTNPRRMDNDGSDLGSGGDDSMVEDTAFLQERIEKVERLQAQLAAVQQALDRPPPRAVLLYENNLPQPVVVRTWGRVCDSLRGVARDRNDAIAVDLYRQAAEQGNIQATYRLGLLHQSGGGAVPLDVSRAAELFEEAATHGLASAQFSLGVLYHTGEGVDQDYGRAKELYERAAARDVSACCNLGWLYEHGKGVGQDLTRAAELYTQATERGDEGAQNNLGMLYEEGRGVKKDLNKARQLYQMAADSGSTNAMVNLAAIFENGSGVEQDQERALQLYERAAAQGNEAARERVGWIERESMAARASEVNGGPSGSSKRKKEGRRGSWLQRVTSGRRTRGAAASSSSVR